MLVPSTKPLLNKVCSVEIWVWWWYRYTFIFTTYVYIYMYVNIYPYLLRPTIYNIHVLQIYIYIHIYIYVCLDLLTIISPLTLAKIFTKCPAQKKMCFFACQIWVRSEAEVAIIGSTIAWGSQFGFRDSQVSRLKVDHAWGMRSFQNTKPNQDANNSKVVPLLSKMKKQIHLCILVIILGISARYVSLQFVIAILGGGGSNPKLYSQTVAIPCKMLEASQSVWCVEFGGHISINLKYLTWPWVCVCVCVGGADFQWKFPMGIRCICCLIAEACVFLLLYNFLRSWVLSLCFNYPPEV